MDEYDGYYDEDSDEGMDDQYYKGLFQFIQISESSHSKWCGSF